MGSAIELAIQIIQAALVYIPAGYAGRDILTAGSTALLAMQADGDRAPNADELASINAAIHAATALPVQAP